jgi:hypothetical protein
MRRRLLWLSIIIVLFEWVLVPFLANWIWSRMDEVIMERRSLITELVFVAARWGMLHPLPWLATVLVVGGLVIGGLIYIGRILSKPYVSIDGVAFYMIRHDIDDDRYIICSDVTITNHRHDRIASVSAEYRYAASMRYIGNDGKETTYHSPTTKKPETSAVPDGVPMNRGSKETLHYCSRCVWSRASLELAI